MSYQTTNELLQGTSQTVAASATNTVVSKVFSIHDPSNIVIDITVSDVNDITGITAKIQDQGADAGWNTKKTVAITGVEEVQTLTFPTKAAATHQDFIIVYNHIGTSYAVALTKPVKEVTTITAVADVSGSLNGKTFILQDNAGSVGFWIDIDNAGTTIPAAASACTRAVEITTIVTGELIGTVASKLRTAVDADAQFVGTGSGNDCIATDAAFGARTDASASTSGFTVTTTTQGVSSEAPSGVLWTAATYKGLADITADTTAAQVAASAETALNLLTGFTASITSSDAAADGTMTLTQVSSGPTTNPVPKNAAESAAGSIAGVQTTAGVDSGTFSIKLSQVDATNDAQWLPLRPKARIVITTGTSDAATIDAIHVSRKLS